jgi:hypothetical protein
VLLIDDPPISARDFTGGEATELQGRLLEASAEALADEAVALAELESLP